MTVISKDLGAVTAYAAAVNRGYTGTKEEFETLMASYATVAQQAAESAGNASQSATNASQSAQTAETAKGTAQQAATDAQTAQASAQGYAQSAQQSAQSASQSATDAESAKDTAIDAVDGFAAGAQQALDGVNQAGNNWKSLAERQAENSEAYAIGTRDGEDVGTSDPAYNNNAKYYAEQGGTSAQTASEAAQTATTKASEAAQSASAAAESARTLTIDDTLTQSGQAADSKAVGDVIGCFGDDVLAYKTVGINLTASGYRLKDDGFSVTDSSYKLTKYKVSSGDLLKVVADDRFQFQSAAGVPSSGTSSRIGKTYQSGSYLLVVPENATYLIVSTPVSESTSHVYLADGKVSDLNTNLINAENLLGFGNGHFAISNGNAHSSDIDRIAISVESGDTYSINVKVTNEVAVTGTVYEIRPDGTSQSNGSFGVGDNSKTAKGDISAIGLYVPPSTADCEIDVVITSKDYIYYKFDEKVDLRTTNLFFAAGEDLVSGSLQTASMTITNDNGGIACLHEIPCLPGEKISIHIPEITGLTYKYRYGFYASSGTYVSQIASTTESTVTIPENCYFLSFGVYAYKDNVEITYNFLVSLPSTKITVEYNDRQALDYLASDSADLVDGKYSIADRNKDALTSVNAASYYGLNGNGVRNYKKQFSMLVTTDVHGDVTRFTSAIRYLNAIPSIDAGICLGDIVASNFASHKDWYAPCIALSEKPYYTVLGNHDGGNGTAGATSATVQEQFDTFIQPTLDKIGDSTITTPWYSVKNDQYKICMVVLDVYDVPDTKSGSDFVVSRGLPTFSQAQITWLISELSDIPSDYTLVIAMHHLNAPVTYQECAWTTPDRTHGSSNTDGIALTGLIDAWINGTAYEYTVSREAGSPLPTVVFDADFTSRGQGLFSCYVTGHTHFDAVGYVTAYPSQKVIICAATANDLYQNVNSDLPRAIGTKAEDCITVIAIDTSAKTVKLVRVGSNVTSALTDRAKYAIKY